MEKTHVKQYAGTPFVIECKEVENAPGTWNSTNISIYKNDILIGEFIRNYPSFSGMTFVPFRCKDEWYALYSAHYTATRVLKLHDDRIEDWCGEEPDKFGFCPVEYFIPRYNVYQSKDIKYYMAENEFKDYAEFSDTTQENLVREEYCNFGFMCGCVWGDDTTWKLRYIDLSKVDEKIISITEKFDYWQLPPKLKLKECIDMSGWEPNHHWIGLTRIEYINLKTDERC